MITTKSLRLFVVRVCCAFAAAVVAAPLLAQNAAFTHVTRTPVVGVMGIPEETETLESIIEKPKVEVHGNFRFISGTILDKKVVLAQVGFGKANAAAGAAILLNQYDADVVIFSGTAGALNPDYIQGDVIVGCDLVQHDLGQVSKEGFTPWQAQMAAEGLEMPKWLSPPESLLGVAREAGKAVKLTRADQTPGVRRPAVWEGVIVTGDSFLSESNKSAELRTRFQADAVEMEGAAVAQVCYQAGVPCLVIRSLTDRADGSAYLTYQKFVKIAGRNAAALVWEIIYRMSGEDLPAKNAPKTRQAWTLVSSTTFAAGSAYSSKFTSIPDMIESQRREVARCADQAVVKAALNVAPGKCLGMTLQPGAKADGPVGISSEIIIEATREEARQVAALIGLLGQKSMVMGVTETGPYSRHALLVENGTTNGWSNMDAIKTQWPKLAHAVPGLCPGFTRLKTSLSDGLMIVDVAGSWSYGTWYDAPGLVQKAAADLGIPVRVTRIEPAFLQVKNSWTDSSKGEQYLDILRRGLSVKDLERVQAASAEVEKAIEKKLEEIAKRNKKNSSK
jgi:adenosylhomocysteine nucleosidase